MLGDLAKHDNKQRLSKSKQLKTSFLKKQVQTILLIKNLGVFLPSVVEMFVLLLLQQSSHPNTCFSPDCNHWDS